MGTMNGNMNTTTPLATQIGYVLLGTATILAVPLVAMQLTSEVNWDGRDFLIMGVLLSSIGFTYVGLSRLVKTGRQRLVLGAGLGLLLFLTWAELAVGIFGSPIAGS